MFGLTIEIVLALYLLASITFDSPVEVIVLALGTNPATIWKVERLEVIWVYLSDFTWLNNLRLKYL